MNPLHGWICPDTVPLYPLRPNFYHAKAQGIFFPEAGAWVHLPSHLLNGGFFQSEWTWNISGVWANLVGASEICLDLVGWRADIVQNCLKTFGACFWKCLGVRFDRAPGTRIHTSWVYPSWKCLQIKSGPDSRTSPTTVQPQVIWKA